MNSLFEPLVQALSNPTLWVSLSVIGALYLLGRNFLGCFNYSELSPEGQEVQRKLSALHETEQPEEPELEPAPYPKSIGRKEHHASLYKLGKARRTRKTNVTEGLVQGYGFALDIDTDRQKLSLVDTKYPTMVKNR